MNNYFEEMIKMQNQMFNAFKEAVTFNSNSNSYFDYMNNLSKLNENLFKNFWPQQNFFKFNGFEPGKDAYFSLMRNYLINLNSSDNILGKTPVQMWDEIKDNFKFFEKNSDFYKNMLSQGKVKFEELKEASTKIQDDYANQVFEYLVPFTTQTQKSLLEDTYETYKKYQDEAYEAMKPWLFFDYSVQDRVKKGPKAYFEFLDTLREKTEDSLKAILEAPNSNYYKDQVKFMEMTLANSAKYTQILSDYYQRVFEIIKEANEEALLEFKEQYKEGLEQTSLEDFTNFVNEKTRYNIDNLLRGEKYTELLEKTKEAFNEYKLNTRKIQEEYLNKNNIANYNELSELKLEVENLKAKRVSGPSKAEFDNLKKELATIKTEVAKKEVAPSKSEFDKLKKDFEALLKEVKELKK